MFVRVCGAVLVGAALCPGPALAEPVAAPAAGAEPEAPPAPAATPLPAPAVELPPPEPRFQRQPFGYLRAQYVAVQDDPNVAFVGRDDGFELQNARIGVRGELDRRIAFVVAFDGAVDEREQVNAPQGKLRVGLRDAFADASLAGRLVARGGFFEAVVDPQSLVSDTTRELVDLPIESRGMRATQGYQAPGLPPGRSLGAAIRFDPGAPGPGAPGPGAPGPGAPGPGAPGQGAPDAGAVALGFELAVQNGADEFSSNNDNDKPAVSAALIVRLPRGWAMAAGRYNPRTVGALPFRQDENDLQGTAGLRLGLGPATLDGGLIVQRTAFPSTGGPEQNAFGGHAQVMVALPVGMPLAIGYRFGILDPSSLIDTDRVMEHTAGAVLGVPRYRMRVQLELTHVVEQAARDLSNDRVQLAAELVL